MKVSKGKSKKKVENTSGVNPFKVYGDLLYSHITKGLSDRFVPLNDSSMQLCYNKCYTNSEVIFYYQVRSFGDEVETELISAIRMRIRRFYRGKVYVDLISRSKPYKIKWSSGAMRNNQRVWKLYKKHTGKAKSDAKREGYTSSFMKRAFSRQERNEASWNHYQKCEADMVGISLYSCVFRIRLPKDDEFKISSIEEDLNEFMKSEGIEIARVSLFMHDFLNELSPFKHEKTQMASKLLADRGMTSDITSRLLSSDQGRLPSGQVYLGNDIFSGDTAYLDFLPRTQAMTSTWIIGGSGAGKSTLTKNIIEQALAWGFYTYVNDYEKTEYTPQGEYYGATFLDLGSGNGKYFEPLRLSPPTGNPDEDSEIWSSAVSNTYAYMNVLKGSALTIGQKSIISKAITELFRQQGISQYDTSTWHRGNVVSLHELFKKVRSFKFSKTLCEEYGSELSELINMLEMYFSDDGVYSYMLRNPISFSELCDCRFIVTRFGRDSKKSLSHEESVEVALKQLTKMILESELGRYRKSRGEHFVTIYEEMQSYLEHQGTEELVSSLFAGIRKLNGTAIGVINDPSKLNGKVMGLITNSENFIVGKINDTRALGDLLTIKQLRGCDSLIDSLNSHTNCFFYRTGNTRTIFKCRIPKAHVESNIYSTRDVEVK